MNYLNDERSARSENYSIRAAAKKIGIGERTLRQELAENKIEFCRIRRRVVITTAAIEAYLARNTVKCSDDRLV